ncbi:MAG TPA: hypothetical protein VIJ28_01895, partial [Chloroflexota bacterium]
VARQAPVRELVLAGAGPRANLTGQPSVQLAPESEESCCAPSEQEVCCESSEKAGCCGDDATGTCGCR